jgi:TonB family protein
MKLTLMASLMLVMSASPQIKHGQACDHAAPPAGMQWVCARENACDCHLEAVATQGEGEEGAASPSSKNSNACLACRVTFFVIPAYPEAARAAQTQGTVTASLILTPEGKVQRVRMQSGDAQLAGAAQAAFQQWRFTGGGREETIPVSVQFVLSKDAGGSVTGRSLLNAVVTAMAGHQDAGRK